MEKGMRHSLRNLSLTTSLLAVVMSLSLPGHAQSAAQKALVEKAHSLETRGHVDLAAQTWQQILLSDPNNAEAMAGLARCAKLSGNDAQAKTYLDRLRQLNPNDPNISKIQSMISNAAQNAKLAQAARLAQAGQQEQALRMYREVFGTKPPDGDWALAYYDTEASTESGRGDAIEGLRDLARRYPSDTRYAITLGRVLTYGPKTRAEGEKLLREYPQDGKAQEALRQALVWDSQNPNAAPAIRQYLKEHPDTALSQALQETEARQAKALSGLAGTAEERAAYASLQANKVDEAQNRFLALNAKQPNNGRVLAGLGFVRMKQGNFAGAITYLEQAVQNGQKNPSVENALSTARFWFTVQEGTAALNAGRTEDAVAKYRAALALRPSSPEALEGLSGALMKQGQFAQAAGVYQQYVKSQPNSEAGWRGLFVAYQQAGNYKDALAVSRRIPAAVQAALAKDPEYLRTLAAAYTSAGQDTDATRVLNQALNLPFPENGHGMRADLRLQYAGLLSQGKHFAQAAGIYNDIIQEDPGNVPAWQGLVDVLHQNGQDADAVTTVERMPPAAYDAALSDPGFLSELASIYQQQNQFEVAQGFLERAAKAQTANGQQPAVPLQLQLASIYLLRNNPDQAYAIYRRVLTAHPERTDAWKGLIASLHLTGHDPEALAQIQQIPPDVRKELAQDVQYDQTLAAVYASTGDTVNALSLFSQIESRYAAQRTAPPSDVEIQNAWLLFNAKQDRALYPALMRLGGRTDLTNEQRRQVQTIWASWSTRRASQAADAGNTRRSLQILNAAAQAFPGNPAVSKALAGGYLKAGQAKEAVEIFQSIDMTTASAADYQAAVGAALAAADLKQAETWLRQALEKTPNDPQVLALAARFEQARGDNARAAEFWRASLNAMPRVSPANELAHALSSPDPVKQTRAQGETAVSLATLLNPDAEIPAARANQPPPLPSYSNSYSRSNGDSNQVPYGPDPSNGGAPVILNNSPTTQNDPYAVPGSTTNQNSGHSQRLGDYRPQSELIPMGGSESAGTISPVYVPRETVADAVPVEGANDTVATVAQAGPSLMNDPQDFLTKKSEHAARARRAKRAAQQAPTADAPVEAYAPVSTPSIEALPVPVAAPPEFAANQPAERVRIPIPAAPVMGQEARSYQAQSQPTTRRGEQDNDVAAYTPAEPIRLPEPAAAAVSQKLWIPPATPAMATATAETDATIPIRQSATVPDTPQSLWIPPLTAAIPTVAAESEATIAASEEPISQAPETNQNIRYVPNAPSTDRFAGAAEALASAGRPLGTYRPVQYTPSPQEATPPPAYTRPQSLPTEATPQSAQSSARQGGSTNLPPQYRPNPIPLTVNPPETQAGLTDDQMLQRNLPPLRGAYTRAFSTPTRPRDPREEAQTQLATIEGGYSPWYGGTGIVNHRSGAAGYDRLTALEEPFEVSSPLGSGGRLTIIARPSFLDSGLADGTNTAMLGTLSTTAATLPPQQNASGVGGEVQLALPNFAASVGYSPYGFLVSNVIGRLSWRPAAGPVSVAFNRDSVKDTQLSYSGLRDPGSAGPTFSGNIWGGLISNGGNIRYAKGDENSGYYITVGGQYISGFHVPTNNRFEGDTGAYWRVLNAPAMGNLSLGVNFFGMHYAKNLRYFTYGQGGYFSPEAYFLASVPISWNGHSGQNLHYSLTGSMGGQAFQEDSSPFFPLDTALEAGVNNAAYPARSSVGGNYDIHGEAAYRLTDHWFLGGFLSVNNSRDYNSQTAGFFVRFLLRSQYPTESGPTGLFPYDGLRPLMVP
jgi:cellulose synthase operon protein C